MRKKNLISFFALLVSFVLHLIALTVIWTGHDTKQLKTQVNARVLEVKLLQSTHPTLRDSPPRRENQVSQVTSLDSIRVRQQTHASQGSVNQSRDKGMSSMLSARPDAMDANSGKASATEVDVTKTQANDDARQGAWLDQLTDDVLRSDRKVHGARQGMALPASRASAASDAMTPSRLSISTPDGGRREQVRSALGTYCVEVPNAANSLRMSNAPRLATVSNCR